MSIRTMEHRWGNRIPVDISVELIGPTRAVFDGRLSDFSISGAFVETEAVVPVMTNITLVINDCGPGRIHPRPIPGYVVRQVEGGIGLGWWKMAPVTVAFMVAVHEALQAGGERFPATRMRG